MRARARLAGGTRRHRPRKPFLVYVLGPNVTDVAGDAPGDTSQAASSLVAPQPELDPGIASMLNVGPLSSETSYTDEEVCDPS